MDWILLFIAGLLEIGWAIGLKYTAGFTKLWPSVATILALTLSFIKLGIAVRTIPVGTGYAVWTGIGALGTAVLGIVLFGEPVTALRVLFLSLLLAGIIGLKFSS